MSGPRREQLESVNARSPKSQGQNLVLTVLHVPSFLDTEVEAEAAKVQKQIMVRGCMAFGCGAKVLSSGIQGSAFSFQDLRFSFQGLGSRVGIGASQ